MKCHHRTQFSSPMPWNSPKCPMITVWQLLFYSSKSSRQSFEVMIFLYFPSFFSSNRVSKGQATYITPHVLSYFSKTTMSGLLCSRWWTFWTLKSHRTFPRSFSITSSRERSYQLSLVGRINVWHSFQWLAWPSLSCPHFVHFWAIFLHSDVTWLIGLSLSPHSRYMSDTSSFSILFLMLLFVLHDLAQGPGVLPFLSLG